MRVDDRIGVMSEGRLVLQEPAAARRRARYPFRDHRSRVVGSEWPSSRSQLGQPQHRLPHPDLVACPDGSSRRPFRIHGETIRAAVVVDGPSAPSHTRESCCRLVMLSRRKGHVTPGIAPDHHGTVAAQGKRSTTWGPDTAWSMVGSCRVCGSTSWGTGSGSGPRLDRVLPR